MKRHAEKKKEMETTGVIPDGIKLDMARKIVKKIRKQRVKYEDSVAKGELDNDTRIQRIQDFQKDASLAFQILPERHAAKLGGMSAFKHNVLFSSDFSLQSLQ